jgi:hypothetical protein
MTDLLTEARDALARHKKGIDAFISSVSTKGVLPKDFIKDYSEYCGETAVLLAKLDAAIKEKA